MIGSLSYIPSWRPAFLLSHPSEVWEGSLNAEEDSRSLRPHQEVQHTTGNAKLHFRPKQSVLHVKLQDGSMRCDVNVSVRERGSSLFGKRVEVKNMNSFASMQKAIDFEIGRQVCGGCSV